MKRTFIIAEAGVNHNGDIKIAKQLIDAAVFAGADAVKFQTFKAESLVSKDAKKAEYQLETTQKQESQYEMLKKLELSNDMHVELMQHCQNKKIIFLSTPFDTDSLHLLMRLNISMIKVPSGEITNLPFLREIAKCSQPIILSTGMSHLQEIKDAVKVLSSSGNKDISVLHCNTQYPTPYEDVNLNVIPTLKRELGLKVGYSDHTKGIEVPIAAAAMGAEIIEKHFTLHKDMAGPDHKASLEPDELVQMVKAIRNIEKALGKSEKIPSSSELKNLEVVRKSIVAKRKIQTGELFSEENLTAKRPGSGVSPMEWDCLIGTAAKKNYETDERIQL